MNEESQDAGTQIPFRVEREQGIWEDSLSNVLRCLIATVNNLNLDIVTKILKKLNLGTMYLNLVVDAILLSHHYKVAFLAITALITVGQLVQLLYQQVETGVTLLLCLLNTSHKYYANQA